jgi:hypothetical protein
MVRVLSGGEGGGELLGETESVGGVAGMGSVAQAVFALVEGVEGGDVGEATVTLGRGHRLGAPGGRARMAEMLIHCMVRQMEQQPRSMLV